MRKRSEVFTSLRFAFPFDWRLKPLSLIVSIRKLQGTQCAIEFPGSETQRAHKPGAVPDWRLNPPDTRSSCAIVLWRQLQGTRRGHTEYDR